MNFIVNKLFFFCFLIIILNGCKQGNSDTDWVVDCNVNEFKIPDYKYNIYTLSFSKDSILVLNKGLTFEKKIKYSIKKNEMRLYISDIIFDLNIVKKEDKSIILKSKYLERDKLINWKKEYEILKEEGYNINLIR